MAISAYQIAQLSAANYSEFRSLALRLTQDESRASDLLQDATYHVLRYRTGFREGTNYRAWVKKIIHNIFLTTYRRRKRRELLVERDRPPLGWATETTVSNTAEVMLAAEDIMARVQALPPIYRRAFELRLNELPYEQIARRTGVAVGTAKSRVHTARRLLRHSLTK
jgi:RNA polymerase sigma-70 factor (ECF subfamily)